MSVHPHILLPPATPAQSSGKGSSSFAHVQKKRQIINEKNSRLIIVKSIHYGSF